MEDSDKRIDDIDLAWDVAHAEKEFRDYACLGSLVMNHAMPLMHISGYRWSEEADAAYKHQNNYKQSLKAVAYFTNRAIYNGDIMQDSYEGVDPPDFMFQGRYYTPDSRQLTQIDRMKKLDIIDRLLKYEHGFNTSIVTNERNRLETESRYYLQSARMEQYTFQKERMLDSLLENPESFDSKKNKMLLRMLDHAAFKGDVINPEVIENFNKATYLERIPLADGFIRKNDVAPAVFEFIAKLAWSKLLTQLGPDLREEVTALPTKHWNSKSVMATATGLVGQFNGTITELSVHKLPITDEWLEAYFNDNTLDNVYEGSLERVAFIAGLKSTGKPLAYSSIETVLYIRGQDEDSSPALVATSRAADRLSAEALQESIRNESKAVAYVIENSRNREILAGLPSLGKNSH